MLKIILPEFEIGDGAPLLLISALVRLKAGTMLCFMQKRCIKLPAQQG